MSEYLNPASQYFVDGTNKPLSGGKVYFYEPGTSTKKNIYTDSGLTQAAANPVILDGGGRIPLRFLETGGYKIEVFNKDDVFQFSRDNIALSDVTPFSDWDSLTTYSINDTVFASDGCFYQSIQDDNVGRNPANEANPEFWTKLIIIKKWNENESFLTNVNPDVIVMGSDNELYKLNGDNTNRDPTTESSRAFWENVGMPDVAKAAAKKYAKSNFK